MSLNDKLKVEQQNKLEEAQKAVGVTPKKDDVSIPEITDDLLVKTKDGREVTIGELKEREMMRQDYSRKTTEVAEVRKQIEKDLVDASQYIGTTQEYFKQDVDAYNAFTNWAKNPDGSSPPVKDKLKPDEGKTPEKKKEDKVQIRRSLEEDNRMAKAYKEIELLKERQRKNDDDKTISQFRTEKKLDESKMQAVIDLANGNYDHKKSAYDNLSIANDVLSGILKSDRKEFESNVREKLGANFLGGKGIVRANSKTQDQEVNDVLFGKDKTPGSTDFL